MTLITELDPSFTFDADLGLVSANDVSLLNAFGSEETVSSYDAGSGDNTIENGEPLGIGTEEGSLHSGTYLGDLTMSTAAVSVGVPFVAELEVQLNPIEGELYQADDGSLHMVSEDPVNDARVGITPTVTVAGVPTTFEGSLADLDEFVAGIPGAGPILDGVADLGQTVLDSAIVTFQYDADGTLIVCFARGTLIGTEHGARPIEDLEVGDRVLTLDNGLKEIRWIESMTLSAKMIAKNPHLRPIRIKAGALGENTPSTDLLVSPQHRVLVRSKIAQRMFGTFEVLAAAKQLLILDGIDVAEDIAEVEYFHFLFDQHEIIYSNGAASESLYPGAQALKSVSVKARDEIFELFPELKYTDSAPVAARELPSGRKARKLAMRHLRKDSPLVM